MEAVRYIDAEAIGAREHARVNSLELDEGEAIDLRIEGARHAGASFARARLVDVEFVRCDLSGCDFSETQWRSVRLVDCRLSSVEIPQSKLRDVRFESCRLDRANLRMTKLESVQFDGCDLQSAEIIAAVLDRVSFAGCDVRCADFSQVRASELDLRGARLNAIAGVGSLRGAIITVEQCVALGPALADALGIHVRDEA